MIIGHINEIVGTKMVGPEIKDAVKQVLVSPENGWDGWVMRLITLEAGGFAPRHTHSWPHINFVYSGQGNLHLDGQDYALSAGSFAYIPGGKLHQFQNNSQEPLVFICIVPEEGEK